MGEGHVTDASIVELAENPHAVLDGMAPFEPNQRSQFAAFPSVNNVFRGFSEHKRLRVPADDVVPYGIDYRSRVLGCLVLTGVPPGYVSCKKLRAHVPFLQA